MSPIVSILGWKTFPKWNIFITIVFCIVSIVLFFTVNCEFPLNCWDEAILEIFTGWCLHLCVGTSENKNKWLYRPLRQTWFYHSFSHRNTFAKRTTKLTFLHVKAMHFSCDIIMAHMTWKLYVAVMTSGHVSFCTFHNPCAQPITKPSPLKSFF